MKDINPDALFLVAFTTVVGAIFGAPLIGAAVGLGYIVAVAFLFS